MPLEFDWVDAFTARPFGGNGCAVVLNAAGLADETCTAIVRETSLTECTFVGPSERADLRVRYFIASREIPFAGHPTVATVAALVDRGLIRGTRATLETGAGVIPVEVESDGSGVPTVTMTQNRPEFGMELAADLVAATGGLSGDDLAAPPRVVSTGLPFVIAMVRDHDRLARLKIDAGALDEMRAAVGGETGALYPFWVAAGGASEAGDTFARLLLVPPQPAEDAFTGSATGAMAAYLWSAGLMERDRFTAEQGHWMGRPGRAEVARLGSADDIEGVRVSGQAYVLMRGYLNL